MSRVDLQREGPHLQNRRSTLETTVRTVNLGRLGPLHTQAPCGGARVRRSSVAFSTSCSGCALRRNCFLQSTLAQLFCMNFIRFGSPGMHWLRVHVGLLIL